MKLLLIDGSNLIFRAYYATEKQQVNTLDNRPANAVNTLISMINKLIVTHQPTHAFIGLDTGGSTFRHEHYPEYKGKRSETPERLRQQFGLAKELYEAMGIKFDATVKYEADDLIATLARKASDLGHKVNIVSGDKDLLQLVDDNITVTTPAMGFSKEVNYTPAVFKEKFEFDPVRFIEYKALVGDSSDNIIGITKVGDKTAKKLILEYPDLQHMVQAAQDGLIKGVVGNNLKDAKQQLDDNMHLVTLVEDIELEYDFTDLTFDGFGSQLMDFLKACGFTKHLNNFSKLVKMPEEETVDFLLNYKTIFEFDANLHTGEQTFVYVQTLFENYQKNPVIGISLVSEKGIFFMAPDKVNQKFISFLQSDAKKVTYDIKKLMVLLGISSVSGFVLDVQIASSLISSDNAKRSIDMIASSYGFNSVNTFEQVYGSKTKPVIPVKSKLITDVCAKGYALSQLYIPIINKLEQLDLHNIYYNIEYPLALVLAKMEIEGVLLDQKGLAKLADSYEILIKELSEKIALYTQINIDSPKQLSEFLFVEKSLPTKNIKKTTGGFSTDVTTLNQLLDMLCIEKQTYQSEIEFINNLLIYRKYKKLYSTYLLGLENHLNEDNRLKPIYQQLLVETGRLSSIDPNIQNIPIKSTEGAEIRRLFVAPDGYKVAAIDYSQVELRIIAHIAQETHMLSDFKSGLDIHSETAKKILHKTEVTAKERSQAKAINFGIIYGMSQYGLAKQLSITNEEAKLFIQRYFQNYPNIEKYMVDATQDAKDKGYSQTLFNRRRYIPTINSSAKMEAQAAMRIAINTPIQGTAADVIKLAMVKVDEYIVQKQLKSKMVMQIHDELVFYIHEDELEVVDAIKNIMETVVDLDVFLMAEANIGNNWLEAK